MCVATFSYVLVRSNQTKFSSQTVPVKILDEKWLRKHVFFQFRLQFKFDLRSVAQKASANHHSFIIEIKEVIRRKKKERRTKEKGGRRKKAGVRREKKGGESRKEEKEGIKKKEKRRRKGEEGSFTKFCPEK